MSIKPEDVMLGKSYQLPNGVVRKVLEIIPEFAHRAGDDASDRDIIRYEAERWGYDDNRYGGRTRVKLKVREKMLRSDFAKEVAKRMD